MKLRILAVIISMLLSFASCGKQSGARGVKLNIEIQPATITDELYVKMNYEFTLTNDFQGFDKENMVFVHFWRKKHEEMLMGDDHLPEQKLTGWKKGDTIKYSRIIFIPKFLDEYEIDFEGDEEIELTAGVYVPEIARSKKVLFKKVLKIQAASLNAPEVVYDEGWWQVETDLKIKMPEERTWRWTTKKAVCVIANPKKESLLILTGRVDKTQLKDQKVIFKLNEQLLEEFIPEEDGFEKRYVITPGMMGNAEEFTLAIETDKAFIPAAVIPGSKDTRELGIRIYKLYFRENLK
ncbi:MAG: hypothetical protein L0Y73_00970 [Candidatus Aminicenantes bacterium]|nr:hypothetical protein [Candidatus Aminicenantes bacterium]